MNSIHTSVLRLYYMIFPENLIFGRSQQIIRLRKFWMVTILSDYDRVFGMLALPLLNKIVEIQLYLSGPVFAQRDVKIGPTSLRPGISFPFFQ